MTTRAVILARGLGTRMKSHNKHAQLSDEQTRTAEQGLKGLIPVGRPFLDYSLSNLADAGVSDVCLVIGPEHAAVRNYYHDTVRSELTRVRIHFAEQLEPRGTADALLAAAAFAGDTPVLVMNADNLYPTAAIRRVANCAGSALVGFDADALIAQGNIPAGRIRSFALVESDSNGRLTAIHEKPDDELYHRLKFSATVSMNLWRFRPTIFDACARVRPSARGELEIQDAVRLAMETGESFQVVLFAGGVLDLSRREDISTVTAILAETPVSL